jgi:hypothetical protein
MRAARSRGPTDPIRPPTGVDARFRYAGGALARAHGAAWQPKVKPACPQTLRRPHAGISPPACVGVRPAGVTAAPLASGHSRHGDELCGAAPVASNDGPMRQDGTLST